VSIGLRPRSLESESMMNKHLIFLATLLSLCVPALADVRLPNVFSDNMVLQRDKVIKVWGWAAPGEHVKVLLTGTA